MRAVIQRVIDANVIANGESTGKIGTGLLILLGIEQMDDTLDAEWLADKIIQMRIFQDEFGKMNLSISQVEGEILVISQFTLHASCKKGNRPSFIKAANPTSALSLYEYFIKYINTRSCKKVQTGLFGADMKVQLTNDGPVTIFLDSKNKE